MRENNKLFKLAIANLTFDFVNLSKDVFFLILIILQIKSLKVFTDRNLDRQTLYIGGFIPKNY